MYPLIAGLGPTELLIILAVIILLFGASKLPELARGSGRALRIFKAETKDLSDDQGVRPTPEQEAAQERERERRELSMRQAELDAEEERARRGEIN